MSGRNHRFLVPFLAVILGPLGGCDGAADPPVVTVADSAGVEIVTSHGGDWANGSPWRLEVDLDVGALDGPQAFGRLRDVAPRRAGGLWVVDAQGRRVRGFDEGGGEVLAFGRPGEGPGEFRSVGRLVEGPDLMLTIGGRMPPELYRFAADGSHRGTEVVDPALYRDAPAEEAAVPMAPSLGDWRFGEDGSAYLHAGTMDIADGDVVRSDVLLRFQPGGEAPDVLRSWTSSVMAGGPTGEIRLLAPEASWSPRADGGHWFTTGDVYQLEGYDASGRLVSIVRRETARAPVTENVRRATLADLEAAADNPAMLAMLERAVFPDSLPATTELWVSRPDGHLWVGVPDPSLPWRPGGPNAWDVFSPDGRFLGRLPIPAGLRPTRITPRYVYGVWEDDLEVNHARRYRIVREE